MDGMSVPPGPIVAAVPVESINDRSNTSFPAFWEREIREQLEEMGVAYVPRKHDAQAVFLAAYVVYAGRTKAAAQADRSIRTVEMWLDQDPIFAKCYKHAKEAASDAIYGEAHIRGVDGIEISVRDRQGNVIGFERRYSDNVLIALMKALDPEQRLNKPKTESQRSDDAWRADMAKAFADPEVLAALDLVADKVAKQKGEGEGD